jgi:hypothetical protein
MVRFFDPANRNPLLYLLPSYLSKLMSLDKQGLREKLMKLKENANSIPPEERQDILDFLDSALKIVHYEV